MAADVKATLRGTRDGVLIVLGDGDWDAVLRDLENQLARPNASAFFRGARVSVETGNRFLQENERADLERVLSRYGIQLGATMPAAAQPSLSPRAERSDMYTRENGSISVLMIRRTLRSGQTIQHEGAVIVYGDVNDGADIVATGDVLIFGKLRGVVHAGASGDDHAMIGAFALNAPQLRIGKFIAASSPGDKQRKARAPEIAVVRDGRIVIEPWRV